MKKSLLYNTSEPLPPFIARLYAMLSQSENQSTIRFVDKRAIVIDNMDTFTKSILPKMFPGLTKEKFLETMVQQYKFFIDKTYLNSKSMMIRLPKTSNPPDMPICKPDTIIEKTPSKPVNKPNFTTNPSKSQYKSEASTKISTPLRVAPQPINDDEAKKLAAYRKFVGQKIFQIQEELIKVRNKYPDKSGELSGLFKYTNKIMDIANEDPFKTSN